MKFISAALFLAITVAALPGQNNKGWGGNWFQGEWAGGYETGWAGGHESGWAGGHETGWASGYETCSTRYITSTNVVYTPTTEYEAKTTYVPYTNQTKSEVLETTLITTEIVKTYTTTLISTYTSVETEVITSTCTEETLVPVTSSMAVVTTYPVPTSVSYISTNVETQTVCCTQDSHGSQGPWYTKSYSGGW